jgi:ATP-dependent RNA helicase RhlE
MSYSYRSSGGSSVASRYSRNRTGQRKTNNRAKKGQYIDPSRFVKEATIVNAEPYVAKHTFMDFSLNPLLKTNLKAKGYETPSPIQDQAIPIGLNGLDIIGIASTGTGKTAAFALPVLNRLMDDKNSAALIIAPTRELAQQIEEECKSFAKGSGLFGTLLIGGTNMGGQLRDLRNNPRVVIGTPGRIKDHLQRGTLKLNRFNMIVLDEVDRMLDMGFVDDVTEILSQVSSDRQSLFFSATIDQRVRRLIDKFTQDPLTVSIKASSSSENVHQDVIRYKGNINKIDKLHDILNKEEVAKVILFDETQRSVERLNIELVKRGFSAEAIHGGKSQGQRQRALQDFKKNKVSILVATDVAARGIDVDDITHVINYSPPQAYQDYIHRIGRAGRAGRIGYALTFVTH